MPSLSVLEFVSAVSGRTVERGYWITQRGDWDAWNARPLAADHDEAHRDRARQKVLQVSSLRSDFAHRDVPGGEQCPEQHGCGLG